MTEVKKVSKTDQYKAHLQAIIKQTTGQKVSKEVAWNLFKNIMAGTVQFTLNQEDHKLPLAGVGNFEVIKTQPRGSKAGLDKEGNPIPGAEVWEFVPRYRFYPSVAVERVVEDFFGLGGHELDKVNYGIYAEDTVEEPAQEEALNEEEVVEETEAFEIEDDVFEDF